MSVCIVHSVSVNQPIQHQNYQEWRQLAYVVHSHKIWVNCTAYAIPFYTSTPRTFFLAQKIFMNPNTRWMGHNKRSGTKQCNLKRSAVWQCVLASASPKQAHIVWFPRLLHSTAAVAWLTCTRVGTAQFVFIVCEPFWPGRYVYWTGMRFIIRKTEIKNISL